MITISLDKSSYRAGDTIIAKIDLRLDQPTRARGIYAKLVCSERKKVKVDRVMDKYDYDRQRDLGVPVSTNIISVTEERSRAWFAQEKKIMGEGDFLSGAYGIQFTLPQNAPPTSREFGHDNLMHVWKVNVKLDIPLAIDENADCEVFVEGL